MFDITDKLEGIDYINVSKLSNTEIGKKLSPAYPYSFKTVFGTVGMIRSAMDFITKHRYPRKLLSKTKLKHHEIEYVQSLKDVDIDKCSIDSMLAYFIIERISADYELKKAILKLNPGIEYVNINVVKSDALDTLVVTRGNIDQVYLDILKDIHIAIHDSKDDITLSLAYLDIINKYSYGNNTSLLNINIVTKDLIK